MASNRNLGTVKRFQEMRGLVPLWYVILGQLSQLSINNIAIAIFKGLSSRAKFQVTSAGYWSRTGNSLAHNCQYIWIFLNMLIGDLLTSQSVDYIILLTEISEQFLCFQLYTKLIRLQTSSHLTLIRKRINVFLQMSY